MSTAEDPRLLLDQPGLTGLLSGLRRRVLQGDIGPLPVIIGLAVIWTVFAIATDGIFLSPFNLVNLVLQMAATGTIAIGVVLVLLLGEIDLSVGAVSGFAAGVMAVLLVKMQLPASVALLAGTGVGVGIGLLQGLWTTRFRVPSFVVTLAGLLAWQGALLYVLGDTGTINLRDPLITGIATTFFEGLVGWVVGVVFIAYVAGRALLNWRNRHAAGLRVAPLIGVILRVAIVSVLVLAGIFVLNQDRGVPSSLIIFVGLIVVFDYITTRTRFGRSMYAIGGNPEAARRAGIDVRGVQTTVFVLGSVLAAFGGILAASRLLAVNQSSGSGDVLLNAIAAAVIGGTSLFGGRGSVWAALLGVLVIQSISNGMDLLSLASSIKFMITGAVLLLAVTIDAVARRGRQASGRA